MSHMPLDGPIRDDLGGSTKMTIINIHAVVVEHFG
jgi:hypothetical protein